jgi:hypothetical protein
LPQDGPIQGQDVNLTPPLKLRPALFTRSLGTIYVTAKMSPRLKWVVSFPLAYTQLLPK